MGAGDQIVRVRCALCVLLSDCSIFRFSRTSQRAAGAGEWGGGGGGSGSGVRRIMSASRSSPGSDAFRLVATDSGPV